MSQVKSQPLLGHLSLYTTSPSLPLFESVPSQQPQQDPSQPSPQHLPHALIFVPGLTDTLGTVPFLPRLASEVERLGYSLVQPQLSSALGGWGVASLDGDAKEIATCVRHLRERAEGAKQKIVLMGHSTGCQDAMAYLSKDRGPNTSLQGAILQAPVSDRQDFEHNHPASDPSSAEDLELLQKATELVNAGKGWTLLPRTPPASERSNTDTQTEKEEDDGDDDDDEDEKSIVLNPPMTAYRFWSLNAKGGDDDYFSSDLDEQTLRRNWETTAARAPILALMGAEDEYVPPNIDRAALLSRWSSLVPAPRLQTHIIQGANHKVDDPKAQESLCALVGRFLEGLGD